MKYLLSLSIAFFLFILNTSAQNHQEIESPTSDVLSLNSTGSSSTVMNFLNSNAALAGGSNKRAYISTNGNVLNLGLSNNNTGGRIEFFGQGLRRMTMNADGRFGIGNIIPTQQLDVDGQVKIRNLPAAADTDSYVTADASGNLRRKSSSSNSAGNYGTVVNPITGKVWLDRNLGATQVATSSTDAASYGDLYQWGRNADGHQIRTSPTTTDITGSPFTLGGEFIISPVDGQWLFSGETDMWSLKGAINNPCPSGFRIPTISEWEQERLTWATNDPAGAFASVLKLPLAGFRGSNDGALKDIGTRGNYWSSEEPLIFGIQALNQGVAYRFPAHGYSVRCIQD